MLGSSQGVLGLNGEAAPEDEGYEGNARTHQQYEVLNALTKGGFVKTELIIIA